MGHDEDGGCHRPFSSGTSGKGPLPPYEVQTVETVYGAPEERYPDKGCELAPTCLDCPFPTCKYDQHVGGQTLLKTTRDQEIRRRFQAGASVDDLIKAYNVSKRTVQRALEGSVV